MMKRIIFLIIVAIMLIGGSIFPLTPIAPAAEGPVRGGILKTAGLQDPPSFNSMTDITFKAAIHAAAVFNGLVRTDPQKKEVNILNIIPDLAEKWNISADGKTYTFYLRQGVKFHDGQPFTAEDVKYSLNMFRDPKVSTFATNVETIDNIEIVNDYTVKINLKYPYSDLLVFLLNPYCPILPAHLKNVDPRSTDFLVGTGPFKLKSKTVGKVYTYERNPDYFIKGLPYLDGYEIYILNFTSMLDQFIGGRLDTAGTLRQFLENKDRMSRIKQMVPEAIIGSEPTGTNRGLYFNLKRKGPWQDVRVRRAMAMMVDYKGALTAAVGGPEVGFLAPAGIIPFSMQGAISEKELMATLGIDKPLEERVAKAKKLLAEAGYPDGFSAVSIAEDVNVTRNSVLFAADLWKRYLNIDVKVEPLDIARLFLVRDKGDWDLYCASLGGSGNSAIELLGNFTSDSRLNSGKWSNTEYDKLFQQILREMDSAKKAEEIRKAQQIFLDGLPYLPFHIAAYATAVRPDMRIGWPPVKAPVLQPGQTTITEVDRIWFAGTPDAERWIKTQK